MSGWWEKKAEETDMEVEQPTVVVDEDILFEELTSPPPLPTPEDTPEVDPDGDGVIEIGVADFMAMIDEAKELAYAEAYQRVQKEEAVKYREKPVYRGILGFISWCAGKMPDSNGKPSGSWTLYVLSHLPALVYTGAVIYYGKAIPISPWIILFPMVLAWVAWLAHHKKVADVVVMIVDAMGRAFAGIKGNSIASVTATVAAAATAPPDPKLKPGKKIDLKKTKKRTRPKTDPNSLPMPPE